jgi:hypothetical protein
LETAAPMHDPKLLALPFGLVLALAAALPARAELVVLTDGRVMKVAQFDADGEDARLTFSSGGRMTMPLLLVERVVEDEVEEPEPEPPAATEAQAALTAMTAAGSAPLPLRFDESQKVPDGPYGEMIYEAARRHSVNPQVVAALIRAESAGNRRAVSHKGARGLMQLMPATAQRFGVRKENLFDPKHNLEAGIRYLSWLIDQFPNDLAKVLAAYNAGEGAVARYGGIPPYRETRTYVRRIFSTLGLTIAEL